MNPETGETINSFTPEGSTHNLKERFNGGIEGVSKFITPENNYVLSLWTGKDQRKSLQATFSSGNILSRVSKGIKVFLYGTLFAAAVYWGLEGDFLDFWDALLWLVAFIFIELNIFEWSEEVKQETDSSYA